MDQIVSDNARAQIGKRVEEILNILQIKDWTSKPYNKNLNFAKRVWQITKSKTEHTLNFSDAPASVWSLALECVCVGIYSVSGYSIYWGNCVPRYSEPGQS